MPTPRHHNPVVIRRRTDLALNPNAPSANGNEKAGPVDEDPLNGAVAAIAQVLASCALLLPVIGAFVLYVRFGQSPVVPSATVASESVGGLALIGLAPFLVAVGPPIMVWLTKAQVRRFNKDSWMFLWLLAGPAALLTPAPGGIVALVSFMLLLGWCSHRIVKSPRIGFAELAGPVYLALAMSAYGYGATPAGDPVYVVSLQPSTISTGWYVQLTDSRDPVYLLSCTGTEVIAVPSSAVALTVYNQGQAHGATLWEMIGEVIHLRGPDLKLGISPHCPVSPPGMPTSPSPSP